VETKLWEAGGCYRPTGTNNHVDLTEMADGLARDLQCIG
jgi:hypothetical protein